MRRLRTLLPLLFLLGLCLAGCSSGSEPLDPPKEEQNQTGQPPAAHDESNQAPDGETTNNATTSDTSNNDTSNNDPVHNGTSDDDADSGDESTTSSPDDDADPPAVSEPEVTLTDATWIAGGDVMMHMPQLPGYYDQATKRYNFDSYFTAIKPIIEQADWRLVNLETPIAGASLGYSGFPRFNAPTELAEALAYAGFNIVTNANNHSLDRGAEGISRTLKALDEQHFVTKGTARSKTESEKLTIVEEKGIRMGLLAYTYGTNGITMPDKMPYAVSLIDEAAIIRDIHKLREAGADFITIALHFGTEYQTKPSEAQMTLARKLIAAGADIIAGAHPHVVQPYELIDVQEQDGSTRRGLIIYSMGNLVSNQRGETKDYGLLMKVALQKNSASGKTTIQDVHPIPTWVYRYKQNGTNRYEILPLQSILQSRSVKGLTSSDYSTLQKSYDTVAARLSSMSAEPVSVQAVP